MTKLLKNIKFGSSVLFDIRTLKLTVGYYFKNFKSLRTL